MLVCASRDRSAVTAALTALGDAARALGAGAAASGPRMMPLIVDAVRARASVGEISDLLSAEWGVYRP